MKIQNSFYLILLLLVSCDSKVIYNEFYSDFKDNRWISNEAKTFAFTIEKEEVGAIILHLGHIYDFQFESIPIEVKIITPDNKTEVLELDIKLKDTEGKDLADCSGDICDLYVPLKEKAMLKNGKYKVVITNKFTLPYLPNILGIGIQIKR